MGCFPSRTGFLLGAVLFQAFKTRRSFSGSAWGGRRRGGRAARATAAPGPARRVGRDAKPREAAGRPRLHSARFWDQSLAAGALWARCSNHQLEALKIPGVRAFIFPPKSPAAPLSDLIERKPPREISFQIPALTTCVWRYFHLPRISIFCPGVMFLSSALGLLGAHLEQAPHCPRVPGAGRKKNNHHH